MLKKGALLVVLTLALSLAAFADSNIDFTNSLGTLTSIGNALSGTSTLTSISGLENFGLITGNNLGTVNFLTGNLLSGSLQTGGTFAAGGTFDIISNGTGIPGGIVFAGTFSQPVSWSVWSYTVGKTTFYNYTLVGVISGILNGQEWTSGVNTQLTATSTSPFPARGTLAVGSGDTNIVHVPEPSTVSMLGMLVIGLGGACWRKFAVQPSTL